MSVPDFAQNTPIINIYHTQYLKFVGYVARSPCVTTLIMFSSFSFFEAKKIVDQSTKEIKQAEVPTDAKQSTPDMLKMKEAKNVDSAIEVETVVQNDASNRGNTVSVAAVEDAGATALAEAEALVESRDKAVEDSAMRKNESEAPCTQSTQKRDIDREELMDASTLSVRTWKRRAHVFRNRARNNTALTPALIGYQKYMLCFIWFMR